MLVSLQANFMFGQTIAYSEEYFLRYFMQILVLSLSIQYFNKPHFVIKAFHSMFLVNGKRKFKHILLALGFRNAVVSVLFVLTLSLSVVVPLVMPIASIVFFVIYCFDKFDFLFIYPMTFESNVTNRKVLVI